jgi:hypothetical protein
VIELDADGNVVKPEGPKAEATNSGDKKNADPKTGGADPNAPVVPRRNAENPR